MQYSTSQLVILFLCFMIIIDDIHTMRLRIPGLRISSSFSKKTHHHKKKNHVINDEMKISDNSIPLEAHPNEKHNEL